MRRLLPFALKALLSVGLFYFAFASVNSAALGDRLHVLKIGWMLAAVVLAYVQLVLMAARWHQIARACNAPLELSKAFRFGLISTFFNQVLPSTVGGDVMRIWLFARKGAGWSKASHSVLLDRFIGLLALALLVVVCLPWTFELIQKPIGRITLLVIGLGSVSGALAFIALGYLRWMWLQAWTPTRHLIQMARTARMFLFSSKIGGLVMVLSFGIHALTAGIAWCTAHAVNVSLEYVEALLLVPPVMLIATVPISVAGWGVREKSLALAFAYAGHSEADGFLVSVLLGAIMFVIGAVGGIVWLTGSERSKVEVVPRES